MAGCDRHVWSKHDIESAFKKKDLVLYEGIIVSKPICICDVDIVLRFFRFSLFVLYWIISFCALSFWFVNSVIRIV